MRNPLFFPLMLFYCFISSIAVNAQTGWQWGKGATMYGLAGGDIEASLVASDWSGGSYQVSNMEGLDSVHVGSFRVIIPTGYSQGTLITKTDASGNYVWVKSIFGNLYPMAITSDGAGNLYFMGSYTQGALTIGTFVLPDPSINFSCFLVKMSPGGSVLWAKSITNPDTFGTSAQMCVDSNSNIYIASNFKSTSITVGTTMLVNHDITGSTYDIFVAKFSSSGNFDWAKSYGTTGDDIQTSITPASSGFIYFGGAGPSGVSMTIGTTTLVPLTGFYAKADTNGNIAWAKIMPNNSRLKAFTSDVSGYIYLTGFMMGIMTVGTHTLTSTGPDIYIVKSDSAGNLLWGNNAGGSDLSISSYLVVNDLCGKLWVGGRMGTEPSTGTDTINFNGHKLSPPAGSFDPIFIAEYDTSGNYLSAIALPSGGDETNGVAVDNLGSIFVCGDYTHTQMIIAHDTLPEFSTHEGFFIAKYKYDPVHCLAEGALSVAPEKNQASNNISLFPNPAYYEFTVRCAEDFPAGSRAEIYDLTGRLLKEYSLTGQSTVLSVAGIAPGMYTCRIVSGNYEVVKKLVVMK